MMDAEPSPPARRRRPRERGQGQRGKRVNLRLSDPEHATLEAVAARHGTTLAGYVSAAALSAAREEMPPDLREMMVRLFAMQHDVVALRTAPDRQPDDVDQAILAMREALENTIEEVINLSRKARGMRALRTLSRLQPAPATPQPAATAVPRPPWNAREWIEQLAELVRQLEDGGTTLAFQHWNHRRLYDALINAVVALGHAHPGGLDELTGKR
ncbi:hypothetical protein EDD27_1487 [Nonomuraea polychroma]|uniref:Mobilization protein n=1 Tax=Nonomuraea polychroma TaxID=46176 RepID=A0A438M0F5_9ACTN|nr:hypothetical protein [Nonomuraea polychroma]RVX39141.1 hypothetical protein EDD27_1487 [Nonomuraea polychroma]